jgi:di/tricarboxylate transporter
MDPDVIKVLVILGLTVTCIVTEVVRIDIVALMAMLSLVWTGVIGGKQALSGFSSNAIMAIIAVMIMGRGLFKSGITDRIASFILSIAGRSESRIRSTVSATVGVMSGFMQNLGAAALFLPVMMGISRRENIPVSNLLMPMGFSALLGGTLTMVGTSSLIVLNDLLGSNGIPEFHLFSVFPIGVVLLISGMLYFFFFGRYLLPSETVHDEEPATPQQSLVNTWGISDTIYEYKIQPDSPLIGMNVEDIEFGAEYNINLLRITDQHRNDHNIWEGTEFRAYQTLVLQGREEDIKSLAEDKELKLAREEVNLPQDSKRGYVEVVIPARSSLVGKTMREVALRETYRAQVVLYFSDSEVVEQNVADREIKAGDTMILHGTWDNLRFFKESEDFITVTPFQVQDRKPDKAWYALSSFVGSISLVFLTGVPISIGFLTGAIAMILSDVISVEEAYQAIEWKVVFLIGGLIPIGIAMNESGTASLIATELVSMMTGTHPFLVLLAVGALTTLFSLFMSNVAATVLLVPLIIEISAGMGLDDPATQGMILLVGVCAANSFIIPTHHVNALLMTPGGYRVKDYIKAGSGLTVLFLLVTVSMIYFLYM